ncbi:MAG: hypothetical protein GY728_06795 [Phycisphaeraceae bacterium]|nr:hypothetical protein [Phycisphaeraceae bacterium]MCP4012802.1 hypothetical protein [Phycisphaeraceae bacterium]
MQLDPIRSIRLVIAAAALVTATLAGGCASTGGGSTIDPGEPTMVLYNAPPTILQSNDERKTAGANAIVGWHADLDDAEGPSARKIGTCNGTMQITRRSGSDQDVEHRMTMIELDWNDSPDSLVVGGSHPYPSKRIQSRTPIYRAILGGTGRFAGAMGEVVSTPLPSGWYRHEIWLVD